MHSKTKKKLYKIALVKQNNERAQTTYRTYRNNLTKILRKAKETYYQTKCTEFKKKTQKSSGK